MSVADITVELLQEHRPDLVESIGARAIATEKAVAKGMAAWEKAKEAAAAEDAKEGEREAAKAAASIRAAGDYAKRHTLPQRSP